MSKQLFLILILCGAVLQSCNTYRCSFGKTYDKIELQNTKKLRRLDLSNQNLKEAPSMISKITDLRMLNLSGNTFLDIEKALEVVPNPEKLQILILDSLALKTIPKSVLRFKNLEHLSLNYNPEINIEEAIEHVLPLPLEFLNIQHNNLVTLPPNITNLTTLTGINLSNNQISNPETLQFLGKLPKLQSLWLTHNDLGDLPQEIGELKSLRFLYLEYNNLSSLPNSVENLEKVNVLHIGHNKFQSLPIQIIKMPRLLLLHVNNCEIIEIPEDFATRKYSLKSIIVDNNNLSEKDKKQWSKEFYSFFIASFE